MYKLAIASVSLTFLIATSAGAAGNPQDNWVVTQLTGDARVVHPGAQPASLKVNNQIAPGDTLLTGPGGRATLVHGGDYILVAPRSELRLPAGAQPSGFTRVIQNLGTLLFKVQHTGIPHFAVDTPMLAAVVKGTTFTVIVDRQRTAVQVIQGRVQVTTIDGGMMRMVDGGRTVFVNHGSPKVLFDADKPAPPAPAPSADSVKISEAEGTPPLAAIAALTGGLVRADVPQQPVAEASTNATATPNTQLASILVDSRHIDALKPGNHGKGGEPGSNNAGGNDNRNGNGPGTNNAGGNGNGNAFGIGNGIGSTGGGLADASKTPGVTPPPVAIPPVVVPTGSTPVVSVPAVTVPPLTTPPVTTPVVSVPSLTVPPVTIPAITVTPVSTPAVTTPAITTPIVTVPSVTVPAVTTPAVTVSPVATPTIPAPVVTIPAVTVPSITTPLISTPVVATPAIGLSPFSLLPKP